MIISLDTETTGLDLYHSARPFFVTICREDGEQQWWEWPVCPLSRQPNIPDKDKDQIRQILKTARGWSKFSDDIADRHAIALQNSKYDVTALKTIGIDDFPWPAVRDTLLAGHLLASNQKHDLTALAIQYLGMDIEPWEERTRKACKKARAWCRFNRKGWAIADEGLSGFPSISGKSSGKGEKDKNWKNDLWLPRLIAEQMEWDKPKEDCDHDWMASDPRRSSLPNDFCRKCLGHRWWIVLREYANTDSAVTLMIWKEMAQEITKRDLQKIYRERLKLLPATGCMERYGLTVKGNALIGQRNVYKDAAVKLGQDMQEIAEGKGYDLVLPKGAVNQSLRTFCLDVLKLEPVYSGKSLTTSPTLDAKTAIPYYLATLPQESLQRRFVESMVEKRERDTAIMFMDSYRRYWLQEGSWDDQRHRLHPVFNPTGSDTLRWSCQNPNAQQISKKKALNLRKCFGPAPGREWWSFDAKNIELRIPAYESGEQDLIDLFERSKEPPYYGSEHLLNFSTIYPDLWEQAVKDHGIDKAGPWIKSSEGYEASWYQWCKNFDFAVGYGAGDETADAAARRPGSRRLVLQRFVKKEALNQHWIQFASRRGYVETLPDKDVDPDRGYPVLCSRTEWGSISPTIPLNYHVQSTAMWWMMMAMIRCDAYLASERKKGFDGWMVLQVHDELVFDFPRGTTEPAWRANLPRAREIVRLMELGGEGISIPVPVSVEWHSLDWASGEDVGREIGR